MRKLIVKLNYIIYALKKINKPHLGDFVKYKGMDCWLVQGVNSPYWDLIVFDPTNQEIRINNVHESQFKISKSPKRLWWSFMHSYSFKMNNWFSNDTYNKKLFDRISKY